MKRAIAVVIVLAGAAIGYRQYAASQPVRAYRAFAEAVLHRDYDGAAAMTAGLTARELERSGTQEHIGAGPAMFQTLFPSRFRIVSRDERDGDLTLTAIQTVLFNPQGVESAIRPAMFADMKQVAVMTRGAGGWKVKSFANEFQRMGELTARR